MPRYTPHAQTAASSARIPRDAEDPEAWRTETILRLAALTKAVSRRYRRRCRQTKRERLGSGNSRAVSDRARSLPEKGIDDASL